MKPLILSLFSIFAMATFSYANVSIGKALLGSNKKEIVPPGTVLYEEGLDVDKTEITNFSWLEYTYWMKSHYGDSSEQYIKALPDTMVWGAENPYASHYFDHPAYHNYPVVGISYEQAVAYCTWRSDRVNEMLFAKKNKLEYHFYKADSTFCEIPKVCTYRLPYLAEWETFAAEPFTEKILESIKKSDQK